MFLVLTIALAWLAVTAVMCVLIGRAIRRADSLDEEQAHQAWLPQGRPPRAPTSPSRVPLTLYLVEGTDLGLFDRADLEIRGLPADAWGSPVARPRPDADAVPPTYPSVPQPRRHPDPPRRGN